jgi:hypothetical protein
VQTKSQVSETGVLELILKPRDIEADSTTETPGLGHNYLKGLPWTARRSIKQSVSFPGTGYAATGSAAAHHRCC